MKFKDMPYARVDFEQVKEKLKTAYGRIKNRQRMGRSSLKFIKNFMS